MFINEVWCSGANVGVRDRGWEGEVVWIGKMGGGRSDETEVV